MTHGGDGEGDGPFRLTACAGRCVVGGETEGMGPVPHPVWKHPKSSGSGAASWLFPQSFSTSVV